MASVGLLALIDDIATLLDDVAILSKVTMKKTAGVLGDDLALNAQQVSGVNAERELPVVWAVAKGSAKNKAMLVPAALLLSAFLPWLITPLLMIGGAFLCFEGFEKIAEKLWHRKETSDHKQKLMASLSDPNFDLMAFEEKKIKGAIRTDFILSAEIVVIALGIVQGAAISKQVLVITLIAIVITIGVYGTVAAIVKLDDLGLHLLQRESPDMVGALSRRLGQWILWFCPHLMKTLSIAGTAAMFLVGGGILAHSTPELSDLLHLVETLPFAAEIPLAVVGTLYNAMVGLGAGALLVGSLYLAKKIKKPV